MRQGYRRLGLSTEAVSAFRSHVLAVRRSWAEANKDTVVLMRRALAAAFHFIRDPANRDEVVRPSWRPRALPKTMRG